MSAVISKYIDIEGMNNTRDLGGMITKDGRRIKPGKLYRSARLNNLKDPDWFTRNVGLVVDFRTTWEVGEQPDPVIPGVENLHLPIFEMQATGVTRDKESEKHMFAPRDPDEALEGMAKVYLRFITEEFSLSQYKKFLRLLFEPRDKAVLWHCTAGKDRTGIGALFIQELLGVEWEDILADYMATGEYMEEETQGHLRRQAEEFGRPLTEAEERSMRCFLSTCEEYPTRVVAKAEELYGSFDDFIREGLGISDAEREAFREMYLE